MPQLASHALVIGGTGMLRGVSIKLAERGLTVSVVARSGEDLALLSQISGRIKPIHRDYRDTSLLLYTLDTAAAAYGPIKLVVAYIHDQPAPQTTAQVARWLDTQATPVRYFDVRGSEATSPLLSTEQRNRRQHQFSSKLKHVEYHEIVLGWISEGDSSRWLTHEETAVGILDAIDAGRESTTVGSVAPWTDRP